MALLDQTPNYDPDVKKRVALPLPSYVNWPCPSSQVYIYNALIEARANRSAMFALEIVATSADTNV